MLDLANIAVEPDLAEQGTWMNYRGGRFLLARPGAEYQAALVREFQENKEILESESTPGAGKGTSVAANAKAAEIEHRLWATHILKDWADVGNAGEPLAYTPELGYKVVSDLRQGDLVQAMKNHVFWERNYQHADDVVAEEVKSSADS